MASLAVAVVMVMVMAVLTSAVPTAPLAVTTAVSTAASTCQVSYALPKDFICCPLFLEGRVDDYNSCAAGFDTPPDCQKYQTRCLFNDTWYNSGDTIFLLPNKCVKLSCVLPSPDQKILWPRVQVDTVGDDNKCCVLGGQMYDEGAVVATSPCVSVSCRASRWLSTYTLQNCEVFFSIGDPHIKTFDNTIYNYYGKCNYTIVQKGCTGPTTSPPFITSSFKTCKPPFREAASCNGEVTIKHSAGLTVTVYDNATVTVDGNAVDFPYTKDTLFIWQEEYHVNIITFNGFYVSYSKNVVLPSFYVYAPASEMNQGWCGLSGTYNGVAADDFTARGGALTDLATFAASWNTQEYNSGDRCTDLPESAKSLCSTELQQKYTSDCESILQLVTDDCNATTATLESCLEDMCGCDAGQEDICLGNIKHAVELKCAKTRMVMSAPGTPAPTPAPGTPAPGAPGAPAPGAPAPGA
ncbi:hypothetical protein OTU49_001865, partial [Cherax quadricarinatus]